ncbi:ParB N-terminal domain-containing protein [Burkholderia sp. F1]|uniref:ParB N-terminal domain-containing protein n=1 Tax=Burkholderia sp. F1 TaxID=3366817 RepID=UPI003D764AE9
MRQQPVESDPQKPELVLLSPELLLPTEECQSDRIREVAAEILREGIWRVPIMVERSSRIVMDGHHRRIFALNHRLARVPCLLLEYSDVVLSAWRDDVDVHPQEIIARGLAGRLYPPKSTRHRLVRPVDFVCEYSLAELWAAARR